MIEVVKKDTLKIHIDTNLIRSHAMIFFYTIFKYEVKLCEV